MQIVIMMMVTTVIMMTMMMVVMKMTTTRAGGEGVPSSLNDTERSELAPVLCLKRFYMKKYGPHHRHKNNSGSRINICRL